MNGQLAFFSICFICALVVWIYQHTSAGKKWIEGKA